MNRKTIIFIGLLFATVAVVAVSMSLIGKSHNMDHSEHSHEEGAVYTCPMHPEIREDKPGSCPICHMNLVKVPSVKSGKVKGSDPKELALNISPYQASLVGIKSISVVEKEVSLAIPVSGRIVSNSKLALQVFEKDLRHIKPGVGFRGRSEIYPEKTITGLITSVDNLVDPSSRTIRVMGKIKSGGQGLILESSFTGQVEIEMGRQMVVPGQAVLFTGKGSFVYKYQDELLIPQKVTLGPKVNDDYVVLKGLEVGDPISSGPNFLIDSESKIRGL